MTAAGQCPLYVDCDGTLIASDLLHEGLAREVVGRPWAWPGLLRAIFAGRPALKKRVATRQPVQPATLPYRPEVLDRLRTAHAEGRTLILATAGDASYAQAVADYLGLFSGVLASDGQTNLKGEAKLTAIRAHAQGPFAYAGDARADLPIWAAAEEAWVVSGDPAVIAAAQRVAPHATVIPVPARTWRAWLKVIRPHQWAKNLLLAVPFLLAHKVGDPAAWLALGLAFLAMSMAASAIYIFNDLVDIDRDRAHRSKHRRPFASASVNVLAGPVVGVLLMAAALTLAILALPGPFAAWLGIYLAVTILYSWGLKHAAVVDVLTLGGLYTLRLIAGAAAVAVPVSQWLLALAVFLFTSLALCKRYTELAPLLASHGPDARTRGYRASDLGVLESAGIGCGLIAVLVLAQFIYSADMATRYQAPWALWLICPLLLYWILRVWVQAARGTMHDDPVIFALRDRPSLIVAALVAVLVVIAAVDPLPGLTWLMPGHV